MWVRKRHDEILAAQRRRLSAWHRLNPEYPFLSGILIGLAFFVGRGLLGARGPFATGTPLPYAPGLWNAFEHEFILGFIVGMLFAYVVQLVRGTLSGPPPRMCPKCWKVLGQLPPCQCGVPWEPIEWWTWIPDVSTSPIDEQKAETPPECPKPPMSNAGDTAQTE